MICCDVCLNFSSKKKKEGWFLSSELFMFIGTCSQYYSSDQYEYLLCTKFKLDIGIIVSFMYFYD